MSGVVAQNTLDNTGLIKSPAGGGAWTFISKATASSDATVSFTSGIDSTYKEYMFYFINLHHSDLANAAVQFNAAGGSGFNETVTNSYFHSYHSEGGAYALELVTGSDNAQATGHIFTSGSIETDNDAGLSGWFHLFDPSNTTFVKQFMSRTSTYGDGNYYHDQYAAGYINTTSAIDEVQFSSQGVGTIDSGDFLLYGLTT